MRIYATYCQPLVDYDINIKQNSQMLYIYCSDIVYTMSHFPGWWCH